MNIFLFKRLYVKGHFVSHRRAETNVYPNESLLKVDGVSDRKSGQFYIGKTVIYALSKKNGKKDFNKGKIVRLHGNSGVLGARFDRNLPTVAHSVRVMMYPSTI